MEISVHICTADSSVDEKKDRGTAAHSPANFLLLCLSLSRFVYVNTHLSQSRWRLTEWSFPSVFLSVSLSVSPSYPSFPFSPFFFFFTLLPLLFPPSLSLCLSPFFLVSFSPFFLPSLQAIEKTEPCSSYTERCMALVKSIRKTIFTWVARGLFERHKLTFVTLLTFRLLQRGVLSDTYDAESFQFLLRGPVKPTPENPLQDWLPNSAWYAVQKLIELPGFENFATNMERDAPSRFKEWLQELRPETVKLPLDWKRLDSQPFRKLLVSSSSYMEITRNTEKRKRKQERERKRERGEKMIER